MSDWEETSLGELIDIKHGYAFKGEFFTEVPNRNALLTPGNFHIGGGFKADKFKYYTGDIPEDYVLSPGAVIVTMTDLSKDGDTLGYSARIPESKNRFLHNQRLGLVTTASKKADINFIYWLLRTDHYQKSVVNSCSGSTVKHTSPSKIKDYEFLLPPISQQKAIDKVLSSFDRKISNLRQQNETLEAIAQTLFKHWFVDFEFPNEDGKPYKSSGGEMGRSELGDIPTGWQVEISRDLIYLQGGFAFKSQDFKSSGNHRILKIRNISGNVVDIQQTDFIDDSVAQKMDSKFKVKSGDVLIAMTGAEVAKMGLVPTTSETFWLNQRVGLFREIVPGGRIFIYCLFTRESHQQLLRDRGSGSSAQPNISGNDIESIPLVKPPQRVLDLFAQLVEPLVRKKCDNLQQIRTLNKTRDRLLPKLMSGQLRITEL